MPSQERDFRGFNAAASLKRVARQGSNAVYPYFRGFNAAASLKRRSEGGTLQRIRNFRGFNAAASLKPGGLRRSPYRLSFTSAVLMPRPH